jgi:Mrp family chromosome partitioning ATPase
MNAAQEASALSPGSPEFDLLRSLLETELSRPAIVAITSSSADDGKELASRGLATSLATAGYMTLLIDATPIAHPTSKASTTSFEEAARRVVPKAESGTLHELSFTNPRTQKTASQRDIQNAFADLRAKFDYIVITTGSGLQTSFASSLLIAADAVLVTVRLGRRQSRDDARLSSLCDRDDVRFLGVVAIESAAIKEALNARTALDRSVDSRRTPSPSPLLT